MSNWTIVEQLIRMPRGNTQYLINNCPLKGLTTSHSGCSPEDCRIAKLERVLACKQPPICTSIVWIRSNFERELRILLESERDDKIERIRNRKKVTEVSNIKMGFDMNDELRAILAAEKERDGIEADEPDQVEVPLKDEVAEDQEARRERPTPLGATVIPQGQTSCGGGSETVTLYTGAGEYKKLTAGQKKILKEAHEQYFSSTEISLEVEEAYDKAKSVVHNAMEMLGTGLILHKKHKALAHLCSAAEKIKVLESDRIAAHEEVKAAEKASTDLRKANNEKAERIEKLEAQNGVTKGKMKEESERVREFRIALNPVIGVEVFGPYVFE